MKILNKDELFQLFSLATTTHYKKSGKYLVRPAIIGETILTIVAGKLETMLTVEEPSFVLRNILIGSSAETYVLKKENFLKRYDLDESKDYMVDCLYWKLGLAKGEIDAYMYTGETIGFKASWGEDMLCEEGDYLSRPRNSSDPYDIYRIEKQAFALTYAPVV